MLQLLSYLFDIRRGEWRRLIVLYTMGLIFLVGITWGETITEAAFLSQVGVSVLPYTFLADAVIAIIAVAMYTLFVDRVSHARLLIGIMGLSAVLVLIGRGLVARPELTFGYPFLYLASHVIKDMFVLHWWTYVNSYYDTQSAKRVVPFIATGARVAGILAGFSMTLLNRLLAPENIVVLWALAIPLVGMGAILMPRLVREDRSDEVALPKPPRDANQKRGWRAYTENIREGWRYVVRSPYLRWMALSTLTLMTLLPLVTFQTSQILKNELQTTAAISSYVGNLTGITNLIMFPIQLFLMGRIIGRLGLGNTNMIYPTGTLITAGSLIGLPAALFSAGLAYFYRTTFRTAFRLTIDNLLYNAVPLRVKGRARAFTTGLLVPVGALFGGSLLILLPIAANTALVPGLIGLLSLAYFISSIFVRREYSRALVTMLEQEDYSFLLQPAEDLNVTSPATLERLKKQAEESTSSEFSIFIAKLMSDVGGKASIPILVQMARSGSPHVRAAIVNILIAADFRSTEVRQLMTEMLADPEGIVRQSAIGGLTRWSEQGAEEVYGLALELLRDPEPDVRLQVVPILIRSGDVYYMAAAMQALGPFLNSPEPRWRAAALRVLAQFDDPRFIQSLLPYLEDADDEVRLEAALVVEALSMRAMPKKIEGLLLKQMSTLLHDPVERVRRAALTILGHLRASTVQPTLISFLTDSSAEIRDTAVEALVQVGDPAALTALTRAENAPLQLKKMLSVVLCRIDKDRSAEAVRGYIRASLIAIYANNVRLETLAPCAEFRGIAVLRSVLRERNDQLLAEVFYLLAAIHTASKIDVIAESLQSDVQRVRANAFEALESLLNPAIMKLVGPLFDRTMQPARLLEFSREVSGVTGSAKDVLRTLGGGGDDPWLRAVVTYALGEIGAIAFPPPAQPEPARIEPPKTEPSKPEPSKPETPAPEESRSRRARRVPGDLLGALEKPSTPEPTEPVPAKIEAVAKVSGLPMSDQTLTRLKVSPCLTLFRQNEIEAMIGPALGDSAPEVRLAARAARRMMSGASQTETTEENMLSTIEKIIFLKEVPFFEGMTVDQLKVLASVCEEQVIASDAVIFDQGDAGGALFVVVRGRVALEREGQRKGSTARIGTVEALSYFGEMQLFEDSPRTERAVALLDTLILRLRREPLMALIRQYPDLSLKLINVLSRRLRESSDRIAQLTTVRPRELHKVFDKLE